MFLLECQKNIQSNDFKIHFLLFNQILTNTKECYLNNLRNKAYITSKTVKMTILIFIQYKYFYIVS